MIKRVVIPIGSELHLWNYGLKPLLTNLTLNNIPPFVAMIGRDDLFVLDQRP